ncbi:MAG: hypothetical protein J5965_10750 [Aeriscardovia sp.]|nr:hypothetical protein [Aeriscardovia sp.]
MKTLNKQLSEMAINNPKLLIENYLFNNAFDDADKWEIIGESLYEIFPYLAISLLFGDEDKGIRDVFLEKYKDKIDSECNKFEEILTMFSPLHRKKKEEFTMRLLSLETHIVDLEDEVKKSRNIIKEQERKNKLDISDKDSKYETLKIDFQELQDKYDYLNSNRNCIVSLDDGTLKNIVVHYFKTEQVYDVSRLTDDTYNFEGLIKKIFDLTCFSIDKTNLVGKKIGSAVSIIKNQIETLQGSATKQLVTGFDSASDMITLNREVIKSIIQGCCKKKDYDPWDVFSTVKIDFAKLTQVFKMQFGVELDLEELKKQSRMDNLENHLWVHLRLGDFSEVTETVKKSFEVIKEIFK